MTYGEVARAAGSPRAARAVGSALRKNPDLARVPCHRVVRFDGGVGGYAGGVRAKIKLLRSEGVEVVKSLKFKVQNSKLQIENQRSKRIEFRYWVDLERYEVQL